MTRTTKEHRPVLEPGQLAPHDLASAATTVAAAHAAVGGPPANAVDAADLLEALVVLRWMQTKLTTIESALIGAARQAGTSWQALAPALGVASRQAAERRYLRLAPAAADQPAGTREGRVHAERDRRATHRAINQWANDNTSDLRRLAGQITALTDLDPTAAADITRLHHALADLDATALPVLLAAARPHLHAHPQLTDQIDAITNQTDQVRRDTAHHRSHRHRLDPADG